MKRFSFSLQKVLDFREFERKQAENELGQAVAAETKIKNALNAVAEQRVQQVQVTDAMHDLRSLYNASCYFHLLDQRKEMLLEELTQAQLVTEEKRNKMREAMKKHKVLEKLKEKRYAAWQEEAQKEEEVLIDDIVTSAAARSDVTA